MKAAVQSLILFLFLFGVVSGKANNAVNNPLVSVIQLLPKNEAQLLPLIHLFETGELDFWRAPSHVNATVDVMVNVKERIKLEEFAKEHKISFKVMVNDLNKYITEKESESSWNFKALRRLNSGRRDLSDTPDSRKDEFGLSMREYHSYPDIVAFMQRIESRLSGNAKVFSIGRTVEGREMMGIKFTSNPVTNSTKRVAWIDAGIHSREWVAASTGTYIIFDLANKILQNDSKLMKMLEYIDIVVFPVLNPDGYEYTRSDPRNALVRMWRKNRSHERCATNRRGEQTCCRGVDLNRNFAYRFAEAGTSDHPCSEIYHGKGEFSEPETRNIRDAIMNSDLTGRIDAFITLHAYSQLFIYPFSNRKKHYPQDIAELKKVAQKAVSAIGRLFGTHYLTGTGPEIIYAYTGGSSDWAKETAKIKYSYTIELRPSYYSVSAWNGFVLDKSQLIPTARETFDGIMVVLDTITSEAKDKAGGRSIPVPTFVSTQTQPTSAPTRMPIFQQHHSQQQQRQFHQPSSSSCRDSVEDCARWLQQSPLLCSTSRTSMKRQCAFTCNLC